MVFVTTAAAPAANAVRIAPAFQERGPEARISGFFNLMPHKVVARSVIVASPRTRYRVSGIGYQEIGLKPETIKPETILPRGGLLPRLLSI
jgi:hypothetical protein